MKRIELAKSIRVRNHDVPDVFVCVDDDMFEELTKRRWIQNVKGYVITSLGGRVTLMTSLIVDVPKGSVVSYRDGDKLNCQRDNLLVLTRAERGAMTAQRYRKHDDV